MYKYVLGVDGGNTKTHYFLYGCDWKFIDYVKAGSCSHEALSDGFEGSRLEMGRQINLLLSRNGISVADIEFAVFGLAGADFDYQKQKLSEIIKGFGFKRFIVDNDGYLPLKAGSMTGTGICSINGTGTVTVGINENGERFQLGGLGEISRDMAGANYIAVRGASLVYSHLFRCGEHTILKNMFFDAFNLHRENYALEITELLRNKKNVLSINQLMEKAESLGDVPVMNLMREIGRELGLTAAGCAQILNFKSEIQIILAGSVWSKGSFNSMRSEFEKTVSVLVDKKVVFTKLNFPPALGAVLWAFEEIGISDKSKDVINKNKLAFLEHAEMLAIS